MKIDWWKSWLVLIGSSLCKNTWYFIYRKIHDQVLIWNVQINWYFVNFLAYIVIWAKYDCEGDLKVLKNTFQIGLTLTTALMCFIKVQSCVFNLQLQKHIEVCSTLLKFCWCSIIEDWRLVQLLLFWKGDAHQRWQMTHSGRYWLFVA